MLTLKMFVYSNIIKKKINSVHLIVLTCVLFLDDNG